MDVIKIYQYALQREYEGRDFFRTNAKRVGHAAAVGVFPLYTGLIVYQLRGDEPLSVQGFTFYVTSVRNLFVEVTSSPGLLVLFLVVLMPLGAASGLAVLFR